MNGDHMDEFKNNPQSKNLDIKDAVIGFLFSFAFFSFLFIIALVVKALS